MHLIAEACFYSFSFNLLVSPQLFNISSNYCNNFDLFPSSISPPAVQFGGNTTVDTSCETNLGLIN
jgi:hypothetical protein